MSASVLPNLMLIADGFASGRPNQAAEEVQRKTARLVEAGMVFVQLRDHAASGFLFEETAGRLVERLRTIRESVIITINSRASTAHELGCGLHIGKRKMVRASESFSPSSHSQAGDERTDQPWPLGYSAHSIEDIQHAVGSGFDYATLSPIFPTQTHPEMPPIGTQALAEISLAVAGFGVIALGGITPERAAACLHDGAYGVAVLSDLLDAADPPGRLKSYQEAGAL